MPSPEYVNLSQIGRMVGVGRVAVARWQRLHENFPAPTGGSVHSPVFATAAIETWLRTHGYLPPRHAPGTITAAGRVEARVLALRLVRTLMPGVLTGRHVDTYTTQAPTDALASLDLLRAYTETADFLAEIVPLVLEAAYLTASGLVTIHGYDRERVDAWLTARRRTDLDCALDAGAGDIGVWTDLAAADVVRIAVEAKWVPDRDAVYAEHAEAAARRLWREVRSGRDVVRVPYELALSAGWLAAYVLGPALGHNPARVDAQLAALTRHITTGLGE